MTADEIRKKAQEAMGDYVEPDSSESFALFEIAAQLAELNENLKAINWIRVDE